MVNVLWICICVSLTFFQGFSAFDLTKPTLEASISKGSAIYGTIHVGNTLYVVRDNSSMIQRFEISNLFSAMNPLDVLKMTGYYDVVHLPRRGSLALLNWFNSTEIFILSLQPPYTMRSFIFTDVQTSSALSVYDNFVDDLILITEGASRMVKEFTPDGNLVRQFRLLISKDPRHTIKLANNVYATTFGYEQTESHYICRFNGNGYVIGRCFGGSFDSGRPGNSSTQLNVPARLAITSDDSYILLADMKNRRLMKISPDMSSGEIFLDGNDGVNHPYRFALDEINKYLFVAENDVSTSGFAVGGKVNAYKFK